MPSDDAVSQSVFDQHNARIWGDIVVWQENVEGSWDIWAADISNIETPVEFGVSQAPSLQINPDISDNLVVWQDFRNGSDWDIYGYNLTTRQEFRITDDDADQINPAVSGNLVVWQDYRDGHPNIYAVRLTGPEVARCRATVSWTWGISPKWLPTGLPAGWTMRRPAPTDRAPAGAGTPWAGTQRIMWHRATKTG